MYCIFFNSLLNESENNINLLEEAVYVFETMYKIFHGFNIEWKVRMNMSLLNTFLDLFQSDYILNNVDSFKNISLNICLELVYDIKVDLKKLSHLNTIFKEVNINFR